MRLYPKKLRGIEDLEKEKKRLQKQAGALEKEDFFSFKKADGKDQKSEKGGLLSDLLSGGNPLVSLLMTFVQRKLLGNETKPTSRKKRNDEGETRKKNILIPIAKEFIGGYLKWKAIELSYKGVKVIVKKYKHRKDSGNPQP